jgi:hypothetical protein
MPASLGVLARLEYKLSHGLAFSLTKLLVSSSYKLDIPPHTLGRFVFHKMLTISGKSAET